MYISLSQFSSTLFWCAPKKDLLSHSVEVAQLSGCQTVRVCCGWHLCNRKVRVCVCAGVSVLVALEKKAIVVVGRTYFALFSGW